LKEREKEREDEKEDVNSHWLTIREREDRYWNLKEEALARTLWRTLWRRLWTCLKTNYSMMMMTMSTK